MWIPISSAPGCCIVLMMKMFRIDPDKVAVCPRDCCALNTLTPKLVRRALWRWCIFSWRDVTLLIVNWLFAVCCVRSERWLSFFVYPFLFSNRRLRARSCCLRRRKILQYKSSFIIRCRPFLVEFVALFGGVGLEQTPVFSTIGRNAGYTVPRAQAEYMDENWPNMAFKLRTLPVS